MSRQFIDDEIMQCDICCMEFDLNNHRPKSLPCGHTICLRCMQNPGMKKCPMCMKDLTGDPGDLPDNISLMRIVERGGGAPPCKVLRREDTVVQQLQRGVDAGRKLVEQLRHLVPLAVEALNHHLDSTVAQLSQMEDTLSKLQKRTPGDEEGTCSPDLLAAEQFQLVVRLEDSLRLLTASKCCVVAEQSADTWTASVTLGPNHHVMRLLLLQLRANAELQKVAVAVGPPRLSTLIMDRSDLEGRKWTVKDIVQNPRICENIRVLQNLTGKGSEEVLRLIRVVAPHLEELEISEHVNVDAVLKQVVEMPSLKRLIINNYNQEIDKHADLPLQLEELELWFPNEKQMRKVQHMPRLRSLMVFNYYGENVSFPPSLHEGLTWLGLCLNVDHKTTMLTLIRAHSKSLRELQIHCEYEDDNDDWCFFFPHLGQDLATCGLHGLPRLVLHRSYFSMSSQCPDVDACLLQRRTVQSFLPPSVEVLCRGCPGSSVIR